MESSTPSSEIFAFYQTLGIKQEIGLEGIPGSKVRGILGSQNRGSAQPRPRRGAGSSSPTPAPAPGNPAFFQWQFPGLHQGDHQDFLPPSNLEYFQGSKRQMVQSRQTYLKKFNHFFRRVASRTPQTLFSPFFLLGAFMALYGARHPLFPIPVLHQLLMVAEAVSFLLPAVRRAHNPCFLTVQMESRQEPPMCGM